MGRALALLLVAVGTGLLVYWLAAPHFLKPDRAALAPPAWRSPETATPAPPETPASPTTAPPQQNSAPPAPLEAPRSTEQKERDDLEAQRAPFYARLRQELGAYLVSARPADPDRATLELYAAADDAQVVPLLLRQGVQPDAYRYGFRRVYFYLPNRPGEVERYRLDTEATCDASGAWHAFRK
jgi:hypothetical protein